MTISVGAKLPDATLQFMGDDGVEHVQLSRLITGKKVVIFGLPGAFTGTCTTSHLPSFMRTREAFSEKGIDAVICISANDPFVVGAWNESTGASASGVTLLGDPSSSFIKSIGMEFSVPAIGFHYRSQRYALVAEDGVVTVLNTEEKENTCHLSRGEELLEKL